MRSSTFCFVLKMKILIVIWSKRPRINDVSNLLNRCDSQTVCFLCYHYNFRTGWYKSNWECGKLSLDLIRYFCSWYESWDLSSTASLHALLRMNKSHDMLLVYHTYIEDLIVYNKNSFISNLNFNSTKMFFFIRLLININDQ